jgi:hypothetical protein
VVSRRRLNGGELELKFTAKYFDNGVVTISLPYETEEVEKAIRKVEHNQYKRHIEELAAILDNHA